LDGEAELLDAKLNRLDEAFRAYLAVARDANFAAREAALTILERL